MCVKPCKVPTFVYLIRFPPNPQVVFMDEIVILIFKTRKQEAQKGEISYPRSHDSSISGLTPQMQGLKTDRLLSSLCYTTFGQQRAEESNITSFSGQPGTALVPWMSQKERHGFVHSPIKKLFIPKLTSCSNLDRSLHLSEFSSHIYKVKKIVFCLQGHKI